MDGDKIVVRRKSTLTQSHNAQHTAGATIHPTAFQPPTVVEENEEKQHSHPLNDHMHGGLGPRRPSGKKRFWQNWHKKQWIIASGIAVVVLGSIGTTGFLLLHSKKAAAPAHPVVAVQSPAPKPVIPTTVPSTLTGLPVDPSVNQRPVTAVMIENSTAARPQSGLDQAGVVFEARAEGGITRFLTLFQDSAPSYIGPVRSVRPYYLEWLLGFDAAVAHVGGSGEALANIKALGVKNLDQEYNSSYYTRISSRPAPHNVYTSIANLNALEAKLGYGASKYAGFARKPEVPSKTPNATSITFNISSAPYAAHYDYNATTNTYTRSEGGAPHMELAQNGTKTQIAPKVVVALVMPQGLEADGLHVVYNTIGSGPMDVFQDGIMTSGTWHKASNTQQFTFTDANGQPLALDPGQTWLTVLGGSNLISYK